MHITFEAVGIRNDDPEAIRQSVRPVHRQLEARSGRGSDSLGWLEYHESFRPAFVREIESTAEEIRNEADVLVVLGIGGSYLGARAVIEALSDPYAPDGIEVRFAGNHLSGTHLKSLLRDLEHRRVYLNVVSKSGSTLETSLAFKVLLDLMVRKYPETFNRRILVTTGIGDGALHAFASRNGIRTFPIPEDIGGRYSVFTAVGLLPMAVAGIHTADLLAGLEEAIRDFSHPDAAVNPAYRYAWARHQLHSQDKVVELFVMHDPRLSCFGEWIRQLFGESEGKNGLGLFPASAQFPADLHAIGQWIQQGPRICFETMIHIRKAEDVLTIPGSPAGLDDYDHLSGRTFEEVEQVMIESAREAHLAGGVPVLTVSVDRLDARTLAYLMYFFMKACATSGYLLGVNPFDQPGVDAFARIMQRKLK